MQINLYAVPNITGEAGRWKAVPNITGEAGRWKAVPNPRAKSNNCWDVFRKK